MVRTLTLLVTAATVATMILVFAPATGNAQTSPPAPERTCTITILSNVVTVEAGSSELPFPEPVECPEGGGFGSTECLRWRYTYRLTAGAETSTINPSAVTVDADIQPVVGQSTAGAQVFNPGVGDGASGGTGLGRNVFDVRAVRFNGPSRTIVGDVITPANAGLGKVTAAARIGGVSGFCGIAGAATLATTAVGVASLTTNQIDQFQGCQINLGLDAKGCPNSINVTGGCTVDENAVLAGQSFLGGNCRLGNGLVTQENPTCIWYCPTSFGTCYKVCR